MIIASIARGHNASTTLLKDGEVVFYLEEERLSKKKYDGAPLLGLMEVFKYVDKIDHLVVCHTHEHGPQLDWTGENLYEGFVRKLAKKDFVFQLHEFYLNHHQMHAACGFYNSGFKSAACVIVDGAGSFLQIEGLKDVCFEFETIFHATYPGNFKSVYKHIGTQEPMGFYHDKDSNVFITEHPGITKAYEAVTQYCGFPAIEAGKLMGLAPYGKPNSSLPPFVVDGFVNRNVIRPNYPNGAFLIPGKHESLKDDYHDHANNKFTDTQKDLAYKIQQESEEYVIELIRKAHELTGEKNIVICGGYGLNCVANYKYQKAFPNLNIYCEPISHDGGTSIGGAKLVWNKLKENTKPSKQSSVYYGPQYDTNTYKSTLDKYDTIKYKTVSASDVAKLISEENIVCLFQGRSEGGPRALGNRSILFDPRVKNGKDIVNEVKHREWFRPFAGSILEEDVHEWFDMAGRDASPHMMYAVNCKPGVEEKIPSIIHVDGTCRIQTVTPEQNLHYYNLISEFKKITGTPVLFNTSFNLGGDPLVETLDDAVRTLENSELNYLYLPEIDTLVWKE